MVWVSGSGCNRRRRSDSPHTRHGRPGSRPPTCAPSGVGNTGYRHGRDTQQYQTSHDTMGTINVSLLIQKDPLTLFYSK